MTAIVPLPTNSQPIDRALILSSLELGRLPVALVASLWDPWTCPAAVLPVLAWAWSVDYWRDWWPEARQRQVIAESRAFHQLKSTIAADRMACGYADAELISYHLPRDGFAVGAMPTPQAYDAWVNGLPEIRIYPLPPRATGAVRPLGGAVGRDPVYRGAPLDRARRQRFVIRIQRVRVIQFIRRRGRDRAVGKHLRVENRPKFAFYHLQPILSSWPPLRPHFMPTFGSLIMKTSSV